MKWNTSLPRMYADKRGLMYPELTKKINGTFFDVYNELGHGWEKQLLNYLRATEVEVGLLFNFGPEGPIQKVCFCE